VIAVGGAGQLGGGGGASFVLLLEDAETARRWNAKAQGLPDPVDVVSGSTSVGCREQLILCPSPFLVNIPSSHRMCCLQFHVR